MSLKLAVVMVQPGSASPYWHNGDVGPAPKLDINTLPEKWQGIWSAYSPIDGEPITCRVFDLNDRGLSVAVVFLRSGKHIYVYETIDDGNDEGIDTLMGCFTGFVWTTSLLS